MPWYYLLVRNGQLSSENLQATAEAAVADQLPPGAHPVDLRSATTTPPPNSSNNLLQPLFDSPCTSPTPPVPQPGGDLRPLPISPTAPSPPPDYLQVPSPQIEREARKIQVSPTVILRQPLEDEMVEEYDNSSLPRPPTVGAPADVRFTAAVAPVVKPPEPGKKNSSPPYVYVLMCHVGEASLCYCTWTNVYMYV